MYTTKDIHRIGLGLQTGSLPKKEWTHAAHIAAAVWLLDQHGQEAFDVMPDMIRRYNVATGVRNTSSEGYHHTITMASLKAIQSACSGEGQSLSDQVRALLEAGYDKPSWLLTHYSRARLFSVQARHEWVEPDLRPLP